MVGVILLIRPHPPRMAGCLVRGKEYEGLLGFDLFMGLTCDTVPSHDRFSIEYHRGTGRRRNGEQGQCVGERGARDEEEGYGLNRVIEAYYRIFRFCSTLVNVAWGYPP